MWNLKKRACAVVGTLPTDKVSKKWPVPLITHLANILSKKLSGRLISFFLLPKLARPCCTGFELSLQGGKVVWKSLVPSTSNPLTGRDNDLFNVFCTNGWFTISALVFLMHMRGLTLQKGLFGISHDVRLKCFVFFRKYLASPAIILKLKTCTPTLWYQKQ